MKAMNIDVHEGAIERVKLWQSGGREPYLHKVMRAQEDQRHSTRQQRGLCLHTKAPIGVMT